jgi:leucyl aminopeptidase
MHKSFTAKGAKPAAIHLFTVSGFESLKDDPFPGARALAKGQGFTGKAGQVVLQAAAGGQLSHVLAGLGDGRDALGVAAISAKLPEGDYDIASDGGLGFAKIAAGWADGAYRFDRYLSEKAKPPRLVIPSGAESDALSREADAVAHLRDLVKRCRGKWPHWPSCMAPS